MIFAVEIFLWGEGYSRVSFLNKIKFKAANRIQGDNSQ